MEKRKVRVRLFSEREESEKLTIRTLSKIQQLEELRVSDFFQKQELI
jgi:hypothetical protein